MTDSILEKGIIGVDEMIKELASLDVQMEKRIAVRANRAGAALYRKVLQRHLKRTTGKGSRTWKSDVEGKKGNTEDVHLYNRIGIKKGKGRNNINHRVGYVGLAKAYGHVNEYGSKHVQGNMLWTKTLKRMGRPILTRQKQVISEEIRKIRNGRS